MARGWSSAAVLIFLQLSQVSPSLHKLPPNELVHLFGSEEAPNTYSITSPVKSTWENGTSIFTIDYLDQRFVFSLTPVHLHDEYLDTKHPSCTYFGQGISHPGSTLALVDCTGVKRGMIITKGGEILLIHPLTPSYGNVSIADADHVIHKRNTWKLEDDPIKVQEMKTNETRLLDGETFSQARNSSYQNQTRLAVVRGSLTVEIALFADGKLWEHFEKIYGSTDAENELHSFVLASVNNVNLLYNHHSLEPKVQMKIKRYHVLKNAPALLLDEAHRSGDVDILLDNFCQYQDSFNPPHDDDPGHWDHALLFTGYDLYRGPLKTVAGYAPVKGMCSGSRSCTINEGLDFGSVFVITHEMGHSLGMFHDGDNGCDIGCCVMSPSVGAGKTTWSTCSVREFNNFLNDLGTQHMPPNCLLDGGSEISNIDYSLHGEYPGQIYNADQQCRFYHGSCWKQELREGQTMDNICDMIWCGEGEGVIRTAHPALEGTHCGENKWCLQGKCREWPANNVQPVPVHGSWSSWNDAPNDACRLNCDAPCRIEGQVKIRRSIRLCENPAPNNGGKPCEGVAYRGILCSDKVCRGPRPNEYASKICTGLRDGTGGPGIFQLSGRGFQHPDQPCRIWCQLQLGSYARSVGNFPDGTPCGDNRNCIKGSCMKRSCGGLSLIMDDSDCPQQSDPADLPSPPETPGWSQWSLWSACSVTCGAGGRRQRMRTCGDNSCQGPSNQLQPCHAPWRCPTSLGTPTIELGSQNRGQQRAFVNTWLTWGQWSQCDVTCGLGLQQRTRKCSGTVCSGNALQSKQCDAGECPSQGNKWTTWTSWTSCSGSCGAGIQDRRRYCRDGLSCLGNNAESRHCLLAACRPWDPPGVIGVWSEWSGWSACSRSCGPGGGAQYRMRACSNSHCLGSNVSFTHCNVFDCPDSNSVAAAIRSDEAQGRWTEWTNWTGCTRTCGAVGTEQRARGCIGRNGDTNSTAVSCQGQPIETRLCAGNTCPGG